MIKITRLPALILAILGLFVFTPASALAGDWLQFQTDAVNSGVTSDTGPVSAMNKAWKQHTAAGLGSGINTTPVIAEDKVIALSIAGQVHAFDLTTGNLSWSRDLGTSATYPFELASPCYAAGNIYVAKQDGEVWALNASTGADVWGPVQLGDTADQLNTPVTYADGLLYVGSAKGAKTYYCLNASDGSVEWSRAGTHGKGYYWAGACVVGDYLVFGGDDGWLTSVEGESGKLVDEEDLNSLEPDAEFIRSSVSYNAGTGRVYLTDQGGFCWAFNFDAGTGDLTYAWHTDIGWSTSTPAVYNGRVYVGDGGYEISGTLHCLNETDGSNIWTFSTPNGGGIQASPVVSTAGGNTYIYFTANCENGAAYCLDADGNQMWEYITEEAGGNGGYVLQGVVISDGLACFGNDGGYLYALRDGYPDWDINEDGSVDYLDMILVGNHYGETGAPGWIREDVNDDGEVDYLDMILVGNHYGE